MKKSLLLLLFLFFFCAIELSAQEVIFYKKTEKAQIGTNYYVRILRINDDFTYQYICQTFYTKKDYRKNLLLTVSGELGKWHLNKDTLFLVSGPYWLIDCSKHTVRVNNSSEVSPYLFQKNQKRLQYIEKEGVYFYMCPQKSVPPYKKKRKITIVDPLLYPLQAKSNRSSKYGAKVKKHVPRRK